MAYSTCKTKIQNHRIFKRNIRAEVLGKFWQINGLNNIWAILEYFLGKPSRYFEELVIIRNFVTFGAQNRTSAVMEQNVLRSSQFEGINQAMC